MNNITVLSERYGLPAEEIFEIILGEQNNVLPGALWYTYGVVVADEEMICYSAKEDKEFHIPYSSFESAEFGIGNGNLWLQCVVNGNPLIFCSARKKWKSDAGKKFIEKISSVTPVQGMEEYNKMTGKLFFLYMFK